MPKWWLKRLAKQRAMICEGCGNQYMSNELKIVRAKVRVTRKKIITSNLALCVRCQQKEIIDGRVDEDV